MSQLRKTVPNNKKVKVAAGSALKDAAKKAGFSPNYGCEEGEALCVSWLGKSLNSIDELVRQMWIL